MQPTAEAHRLHRLDAADEIHHPHVFGVFIGRENRH